MQITLRRKGKGNHKNKKLNIVPRLFLIVTLIILGFSICYPLISQIWTSFGNITLVNLVSGRYPFIGLDNYKRILSDGVFYSTLLRTITWTVVIVGSNLVIGFCLALLLNQRLIGKKVVRTILILPWAMPQYIVALTWKNMFNFEYGAINILLTRLFGSGAAIQWLSDPQWTFIASILTSIWIGVPFMMMIILGGLQSISSELYQAAEVDGATGFQKLKNVTLPLMKPILTPVIVLGIISTFNNISIISIMTNGTYFDESQILVSMAYRLGYESYRFGYSAAFSIITFAIQLFLIVLLIRAQKLEY